MATLSKRILVVEDDPELGAQIRDALERERYVVEWWSEGRSVTAQDLRGLDLVVLDLMLPGLPGLDLLKQVRAVSDVPVLVLSARSETRDKIRAFELGGDDYLTKPFWPGELIERVRARLRRPALARGDVIAVGALEVGVAAHEVRLDGVPIALTPVEFALLHALARRAGEAVTRSWLVEHVLDPEREGGDRTLDVHISRIRKKLGGNAMLQTVWGVGYRLSREGEG